MITHTPVGCPHTPLPRAGLSRFRQARRRCLRVTHYATTSRLAVPIAHRPAPHSGIVGTVAPWTASPTGCSASNSARRPGSARRPQRRRRRCRHTGKPYRKDLRRILALHVAQQQIMTRGVLPDYAPHLPQNRESGALVAQVAH